MVEKPTKVVVSGKFDLGYLVTFDGDKTGQLRAVEMQGNVLDLHVSGNEHELFGKELSLYLVLSNEHGALFSQFSETERNEKERIDELKQLAIKNCELGEIYKVTIEANYSWGYICEEIGGHLHGSILKPSQELEVGSTVTVKIISKSERGAPRFEVAHVDI